MKTNRKAIIIGGNHHNTLGVIRSLGQKGIMPYVIITSGTKDSFVLKSKYINKSWVVDGSAAAIELLLSEFNKESEKPIIISCHDGISSQIDLNFDRLKPYFILPGIEKQGRVTELMNKKIMGDFASKSGLNIPQTYILDKLNYHLYANSIPVPCITKPVESRCGNKSEIHVFNNKGQLEKFLIKKTNKSYLVQQFVEKKFEFQLIGCSLQSGNDIVIPGVSIIIRQPNTTNTGFLHYIALDNSFQETVENTKSFIRKIGYSGLFSVEFLRDKNGKDFFMEINFRNDGNCISVSNAGVNLPYIWYLAGLGNDYTPEIMPIHEEFVMPEFAELSLYICGNITFRQMEEDMRQATSYMDFDPQDPEPTDGWNQYKKQKRYAKLKRIARKIYKIIK